MSVEKFHLIRKAQRGFDVIANAVFDDEELIEKGIPKAIQARKTGGAYGTARRKANRAGRQAALFYSGKTTSVGRAFADERKARGMRAREEAREIANGAKVEKGLPSIARQLMREAGTTGRQMSHGEGFYASHEALGVAPHAGSGGYSRSHVLSRKISANQGGRRTGKDLKIVAGREGGLSDWERNNRIEAQKIQGRGNNQFARDLAAKQPGRLGGAGNVQRQKAIAARAAAQRPGAPGRSALAGQTGGMDARGLQAAGGVSSSTLADRALAANARNGFSRPAPAPKKRRLFGR